MTAPGTTAQTAAEIVALRGVLWFLPAPARTQFATGLHALGVRVHPELATKTLQRDSPAWTGQHARHAVTDTLQRLAPDIAATVVDPQPGDRERMGAEALRALRAAQQLRADGQVNP